MILTPELFQENLGYTAELCQHSSIPQWLLKPQIQDLLTIAETLRDHPHLQMNMPIDCTAIDHSQHKTQPKPEFEVIWQVFSITHNHRCRLHIHVPYTHPLVPSLTAIWPGFNWPERETWDMYGIEFEQHPNLSRILMYEEFVGHPLRKDYPVDKRQPLIPMRDPPQEIRTQRHPLTSMLNKP
jgi:NADH-quinone oxidoreductase subunit C